MNKELLLEGAVAGHMNHIYDNGEMTFGELKQLLQAAADGKLQGTEKTDGQNLLISFNVKTGRAVAIRNQTMIKAGGLNSDDMDSYFSEHPNQAIRYSFVEAIEAFEEAIQKLDKETQIKIFGEGVRVTYADSAEEGKAKFLSARASGSIIYYNTEVMNPGTGGAGLDPRTAGTTNVIPYDKKTLLIHRVGHSAFNSATGKRIDTDVQSSFEALESALIGEATDDPGVFSIETNPVRMLPPLKNKEILDKTTSEVTNLMSDARMNDMNTINDYVIAQLVPQINRLGLADDTNKIILRKIMKISDEGPIPAINVITKGMPPEIKEEVYSLVNGFDYADYTRNLQMVLHDFSVAMIDGLESSFISDNEKAIAHLRGIANEYKKAIEASSNEDAKRALIRQWNKLKDAKNINTPSEGFVFTFNGVTYKFTGAFAPLNQIIGIRKYGRYGPIEAPEEQEELPAEEETTALKEEMTIALFPGSFKPPHKGHLLAAESLGADADLVYIFVSAPALSGRTMRSGKSISPDQAVQCWQIMLDKSPIKNKAKVMIGPPGVASPMMTAFNFIQHPADPNNIYAAPENAKVILGVGAKGSDADRYGDKVLRKSKELRPDLEIQTKAVGPFTHSDDYVSLLEANPTILGMLNKGKGRTTDKHLYHASDMRDFIDLATEDPIGIRFLQDFVPNPEDALAIMGILGLNPKDPRDDESDQVEEPELDAQDIREMIEKSLEAILEEGFNAQKPPKGKPSSDPFQVKMRDRLKVAHNDYLKKGDGPKGHHGGGFRLDPTLGVSNAYLAEEEVEEAEDVEEVSSMAAGSVAIGSGPLGKKRKTLEEEEDMATEAELRKTIRIGIKEYFKNKKEESENLIEYIIQEHDLRMSLRSLIIESASEDPVADVSDSTGINTLKDLLKNTNVLSSLRNVYKTLTTNDDQKLSFRAHIVKWIQDTLAPVRLNDTDAEALAGISENVGIDIEGVDAKTQPGDEEKFIEVPDGSEKDQPPEEEEEEEPMQPISGADTTGRNKAERIYPTIEKSIIDYYAELDDPEDMELFYDYLIANTKLYFDKWDGEMATGVTEPTNDEYERAKKAI